jgi:hypothetical protein
VGEMSAVCDKEMIFPKGLGHIIRYVLLRRNEDTISTQSLRFHYLGRGFAPRFRLSILIPLVFIHKRQIPRRAWN